MNCNKGNGGINTVIFHSKKERERTPRGYLSLNLNVENNMKMSHYAPLRGLNLLDITSIDL